MPSVIRIVLEFPSVMTSDEFQARYAKSIATLWRNIIRQYGVTEAQFGRRLYMSATRSGELDASDGTHYLSSVRADELCLVIACESGDDLAWRDLEASYRHSVEVAARTLTRDDAEAEDLTQVVFAELFGLRVEGEHRVGKLSHYSGRGSLAGWLRAIVYQEFINRKRQNSRLEQVEEMEEFERLAAKAAPLSTPFVRPDQVEDTRLRGATDEAMARGFAELEARDRLLLNYYYFDELTLKEIGSLLNVHEATVSRWLHKTLIKARRKTEEILRRDFGMRRSEVAECLQIAAQSEVDVKELLRESKSF
jgi:RNA polymerase sigma-70 factor, ECF subfamily